MPDPIVPPNLKNPNAPPTSELQESYNDLRKFLQLKTNNDLLSATDQSRTQPTDNLSNNALAISTILSPDGAFFTKDIPKILQQLGMTPGNTVSSTESDSKELLTTRGDINVYGAGASEYGDSLFSVVGINKDKFLLKSGETAQTLQASAAKSRTEGDLLIDQSVALTEQIVNKRQESKKPSLTDDQKAAIEKEIKDLTAQRDDLDKRAGDLSQKSISSFERSRAFKQEAQTKSVLATSINVSPDQVDAINNAHVSLYRHVSKYSDPSSVASDYCNVFFNAIDSINMSLCVPYFRMNIVDRFAKKKGRYSKLSLAAFLRQSSDPTGDKIFYEAEPLIYNTSRSVQKKIKSGKVVGMETFFAPQTLLPDPTEILSDPRRLDTSVPLLSLNSFSIGIESVGIALLSKKTADLSITLHDRSRLTDISPLVSIGNFSSLYFEIEWGWTHPHGEAKFDNPVARYLNSLRYREVFAPISYNMSMGENGAMTINIRLIGGTSVDAVNGSILNGGFLTRAYASQILDKLIKSEIREESGEKQATEEVRTVTQVLIDKSRTANMVDGKFIKEIWKYVSNDERSQDDRKQLITLLKDTLDQSVYYKNEEIFEKIRNNIPLVSAYKPSADIFRSLKGQYGTAIVEQDFTSVASYLTLLVGMPLAATGLYSEVQIHTFKFNEGAGKMAGQLIADAPVRIDDVFRDPSAPGSLSQNTSISNAITLLGNYLSNPKQPIYGISNQAEYEKIKVGVSTQPSGDPAKATEAKVSNDKAPDSFDKPPDFTTPNIKFTIRAVPAKEYSSEREKTIANYVVNPEKLIAQIIIYDGNSSPNFDKIIGAYGYTKLKELNGKKITPDIAKNVFKDTFPSIVYGSTNSVIKSISVSTDINNAIGQQNTIDVGKEIILGRSKSDASSDIGEISLFPGSVTISMIGLPIIERGQEVYLDIGTGTTLDALYYVSSVKHDFRPGEFTTNLTLIYKGQGSVMSLTTMLEQFNKTLPSAQKAKVTDAPKESAPTKAESASPRENTSATSNSDKSASEIELEKSLAEEAKRRDRAYSRALNRFGPSR